MTLNDMIVQLQMTLDIAKEHIEELEAGKKVASPKAREALQKIKLIAHELRKQCITTQKSIPVKSRVKVAPTEAPVAEPEAPVVVPKKTKRRTK